MTDEKQEQGGTWGGIVTLVLIGAVLAGVDEDVERNINDIEVGECVAMEGDTALRTDCGEPGALEVLALDPDPKTFDEPALPGIPGTCEKLGAPEATHYY